MKPNVEHHYSATLDTNTVTAHRTKPKTRCMALLPTVK